MNETSSRGRLGWFFSFAVVVLLAMLGCSPGGNHITVEAPWLRAAAVPVTGAEGSPTTGEMSGTNTAAFMTLRNPTAQDDRLIAARSDAARVVEIHETIMDGEVMRMHPLEEGVLLPAGETVELSPGGIHIMLIDIQRDLQPGEKVAITLELEQAGSMTVEAEVRQP